MSARIVVLMVLSIVGAAALTLIYCHIVCTLERLARKRWSRAGVVVTAISFLVQLLPVGVFCWLIGGAA